MLDLIILLTAAVKLVAEFINLWQNATCKKKRKKH